LTPVVKREFISGFQGGDGSRIRWTKCGNLYGYNCGETSQSIKTEYRESLSYMMNQCVQLLEGFGIKVSHLREFKSRLEDRIIIAYKISDEHDNLIRYFDTIGYRYDLYKTMASAKVIEYLKIRREVEKKYEILVEGIHQNRELGKSRLEISKMFGVDMNFVKNTIKNYGKVGKLRPRLGSKTVDYWISIFEEKTFSLFVPVEKIEEVKNRMIADITVESNNHSFIANGFLSSNSGIKRGPSQGESLG